MRPYYRAHPDNRNIGRAANARKKNFIEGVDAEGLAP
jgi:hypothetical protein